MVAIMKQEMQAIVLAAGPGMRMITLTSKISKCLLPVGSMPMICYPLQLLQDAGFSDVTVVVRSGEENLVKKHIIQCGLKIGLDMAAVNAANDPGTADSLRHIAAKIKKNVEDVVILTSDLITDAKLQPILDQHRLKGSALTMVTADQLPDFTKTTPPGPKSKMAIAHDVLCTESGSGRLMYDVAGGDYGDMIELSSAVTSAATSPLQVSTSAVDVHLYVLKRWLLEYILSDNSPCQKMGSLKAEIIPHVISRQFTKPPQPITDKSVTRKLDIHDMMPTEEYADLISSYNTSVLPSIYHWSKSIDARVCHTFHHPGMCIRVNTLGTYWALNRKIIPLWPLVNHNSTWSLRRSSAEINSRAQVSDDSVIGESATINEKTNIISTTVGNFCTVKPMVRLLNSMLTDRCEIASGCLIENSLISSSIDKKCTIKNCIVTDGSRIEENETYENEILEMAEDFGV